MCLKYESRSKALYKRRIMTLYRRVCACCNKQETLIFLRRLNGPSYMVTSSNAHTRSSFDNFDACLMTLFSLCARTPPSSSLSYHHPTTIFSFFSSPIFVDFFLFFFHSFKQQFHYKKFIGDQR